MADLSLKIRADFDAAHAAFEKLQAESEAAGKSLGKFTKEFPEKAVDQFIAKQNRAGAAIMAAKGEVEALEAKHKAYRSEIERLIKSGLDPESTAVIKLQKEYDTLGKELEKEKNKKKLLENSAKAAGTALKALTAATAAATVAIGAMVQTTAKAGDTAAKTARIVGTSAESWQELSYAANMSGVETGLLQSSMQKLNKSMGDLKNGTGSLSKYLGNNNQELLKSLQSANGTEEAFMLLMDAIKKTPDEFTRAQLAQEAFGKAGQDLILMAENGTDGLKALREEAQKYGIISNDSAAASEAFLDAQQRAQTALAGVKTAFSEKLLPSLTGVINKFADGVVKITEFIQGIKDLPGILEKIAWAIGIVTVALGTLIIIDKISKAMAALNAIMLANPFALIAAAIAAVVVGLIALYQNWDVVQTYLQQGVARLEFAFKWFANIIKEKLLIEFSIIKAAGATLIDFIYGNIIRSVGKMLDVMGKLPFVGELFNKAADTVNGLGNAMKDMASDARGAVGETIEAAKEEQRELTEILRQKIEDTDAAARARRDEIEELKRQNAEELLLAQERVNIEKEANEEILESDKDLKDNQEKLLQDKKNAFKTFTDGFGQLLDIMGEKNRAAAIAGKALASAEAIVNTYWAASEALKSAPPPWNFIAMAGVIAAGLANQIKIVTTSIPSAETGGRFVVPDVSPRIDGVGLRVNPGEKINVTPRGMSGDDTVCTFNFYVNEDVFARIINKQAKAGALYNLQLAGNL